MVFKKQKRIGGRVVQLVTCPADRCLTADPGVTSLIPAQPKNFMEINHEI